MKRLADLLIIAKQPLPGRVKTRLTPEYSPAEAAELATAALTDTLRVAADTPARRRILVLEGEPGDWLPKGFTVIRQRGRGLDERLANAFTDAGGPALLIGMDTPQVTPELLAPVTDLDSWGCDAWFGPADDGGFWALALAEPDPGLLLGVPMSRDDTGRRQRQRLLRAGLRVRDLPRLRDVDTAADVDFVARLAPDGRFAATAYRLGHSTTPRGAL
ncbi:MAG: TIGR04282 family arsenosugar biosynthesis glycosyltransferase [Stackebrandtia sp.]